MKNIFVFENPNVFKNVCISDFISSKKLDFRTVINIEKAIKNKIKIGIINDVNEIQAPNWSISTYTVGKSKNSAQSAIKIDTTKMGVETTIKDKTDQTKSEIPFLFFAKKYPANIEHI
ncbi:hypothetical protein [Mycoplasma sp. Ms02]|uniref:hypothetical protein n=1 Tax=Mycoplasma sp. Ms02 TaxID=353851 RepID=UPI001C89613A|nr:hypothetical protein [Mycoplasma sp. Ms02]QZE12305.1 hypothetical protein K4L35_03160 [Mycoplasma sp. Ms02]